MADYKPTSPNNYNKPQLILSSGRILFNAVEDSILFFGKKSIAFSANETINFDCGKHFVVNSPKIYLGLKEGNLIPTEPLLLGNKSTDWLKELINSIQTLSKSLEKLTGVEPDVPYVDVNLSASSLTETLVKLRGEITALKSKQNYTV